MTTRITQADLERLVTILNEEMPGQDFALDMAYGGVKLSSHAGSRAVSTGGYGTKRELYTWIHAYRDGAYAARS